MTLKYPDLNRQFASEPPPQERAGSMNIAELALFENLVRKCATEI
jgi:hypothetical protein